MIARTLFVLALCAPLPVAAGDFLLSITDTGKREYYCQLMVTLDNQSGAELPEISGFFYAYIGDQQVGRSKGAWFMNVPADGEMEATFETPNAPCDEIERYEFVVGACRFDQSFADKSECAARIEGTGQIGLARPS